MANWKSSGSESTSETAAGRELGGRAGVALREGKSLVGLSLQDVMGLPNLRKACYLKSSKLRYKKETTKTGTRVFIFFLGLHEYFILDLAKRKKG